MSTETAYRVVNELENLDDVNLSSVQGGQVLTYNATSGKWENANSAGGGAVDSVNGQTGVVVLSYTDLGAAASSHGHAATDIANGSVSNTEFQYLDGVTSNIQTQLNAKASASQHMGLALDFDAHVANVSNPHTVTAAQVGAYTSGQVDTLLATKANTSSLGTIASQNANSVTITGGTVSGLSALNVGTSSVDAQLRVFAADGVNTTGVLCLDTGTSYGTWQNSGSFEGVSVNGSGIVNGYSPLWLNYYSDQYVNLGHGGGGVSIGQDTGSVSLGDTITFLVNGDSEFMGNVTADEIDADKVTADNLDFSRGVAFYSGDTLSSGTYYPTLPADVASSVVGYRIITQSDQQNVEVEIWKSSTFTGTKTQVAVTDPLLLLEGSTDVSGNASTFDNTAIAAGDILWIKSTGNLTLDGDVTVILKLRRV